MRGLTTAASIWITAAIGILTGIGFYFAACSARVLALGTLSVFRWIEARLPTESYADFMVRFARDEVMAEAALRRLVAEHGFSIAQPELPAARRGGMFEYRMVLRTLRRRQPAQRLSDDAQSRSARARVPHRARQRLSSLLDRRARRGLRARRARQRAARIPAPRLRPAQRRARRTNGARAAASCVLRQLRLAFRSAHALAAGAACCGFIPHASRRSPRFSTGIWRRMAGSRAGATSTAAGGATFERPYGWAWLLELQAELLRHGQRRWSAPLQPLAGELARRMAAFVERCALSGPRRQPRQHRLRLPARARLRARREATSAGGRDPRAAQRWYGARPRRAACATSLRWTTSCRRRWSKPLLMKEVLPADEFKPG